MEANTCKTFLVTTKMIVHKKKLIGAGIAVFIEQSDGGGIVVFKPVAHDRDAHGAAIDLQPRARGGGGFIIRRPGVDIGEAIESGKTVIFSFRRGLVSPNVIATIGQFISYQVLSYVFKRKGGSVPVHLVYDECKFFLSQTTVNILTEARKYDLYLIMATQQLEAIPAHIRNAILANAGTQIAGKNAQKTAKPMAQKLDISEDDIILLNDYSFFVRIDSGQKKVQTFRVKIPLISGEKFMMSYQKYLSIIEGQKEKYYRKREHFALQNHDKPVADSKPYSPTVPNHEDDEE